MKILIACEESQRVCIAFRKKGHEAYSCDILPCSGGHTEWHIQDDVLKHLNDGWDMMIAHPPCTHLSVTGQRWFTEGKKDYQLQRDAIDFVEKLWKAPIDKIMIENPRSVLSTRSSLGKSTQTIQPWQFGEGENKTTCLWLKNLPKLIPTKIIQREERKNTVWLMPPSKNRALLRSKTFQGIADAMAEQWG